jgi:hypothetical protein
MLHKDYHRKGSVEKKSLFGSEGAWRQDKMIDGKSPVASNSDFGFDLWVGSAFEVSPIRYLQLKVTK